MTYTIDTLIALLYHTSIEIQIELSKNTFSDFIMGAMAYQITNLTIVYLTVYSGADQRKHQGSASLAFVRGIHRWSVNSPHKGPAMRKIFPLDDVIMIIHPRWSTQLIHWLLKYNRLSIIIFCRKIITALQFRSLMSWNERTKQATEDVKTNHYSDVIASAMASQITRVSIVCSNVWSGADQRKHQSSASLAFVRGIHRSPVDSPHKGPVTREIFKFDDVITGLYISG